MAKRPAFVLPDGLELELTDDTISIRYEGDLRIESTLGRRIGEIHASGDIDLALKEVTGTVSAGGKLVLNCAIDAEVLHAREIVLGKQSVKATAISATERITIGAATLAVDCIIAPDIILDPKASGRVTVIESQNERGATKIKGGFTLADYDDMFGNAAEFLAERGLEPLGELSTTKVPVRAKGKSEDQEEEEEEDPDEAPEDDEEPEVEVEPQPEPEPEPEEEDIDDPLSLSIDDIEELVEEMHRAEADGGADAQVFADLAEALNRISACYEGADLPPAVSELQLLVEQRDLPALRENITEVWNGLLSFHQKRGIRPHHQVTHAFNQIHGLIQA